MKRTAHLLTVTLCSAALLASCSQTPAAPEQAATPDQASTAPAVSVRSQILDLAQQPELQDPDIQRILRDNADDAALLERLQGNHPTEGPALQAQGLSGRALYTYGVATGSVSYYWNERAAPNYSGLNWGYDGCSVPQWILDRSETARTYKAKFNQPCIVHDFGYRNASAITSNWAVGQGYRLLVDQAFGRNMDRVCAGVSNYFSRVKCYAVSYAFEKAVTLGGFNKLDL